MIALRLVDTRQKVALATHPRMFKTLDACWRAIKREHGWKRGGLRMPEQPDSGPHFHVQAEAYTMGGVLMRWVWLEICTSDVVYGPHGPLPGSAQLVNRRMEWVGVTEDVAQELARAVDAVPETPVEAQP